MAPEADKSYKVVVNVVGLYDVWPADKQVERNWIDTGKRGSYLECKEIARQMQQQQPHPPHPGMGGGPHR